ncbi:MAG TPA: PH domain-containing protein [Bacteroidales bacterium]|nr:PH domain-containing protein [Bacteroidales bacterium]
MNKIYKSKIGIGLVTFIVILISISSLPLFLGAFSWIGFFIVLLTVIFILYIFLSIVYVIDGENLIVKNSFLKPQIIDIKTIKEISETHNPISAPAASLDRIEIKYGKNCSIIVSPKKKKEFISDLIKINSTIVIK